MSTRRAAAPPPQLPGFTFHDVLGSGGFADVYLFEQHLPRRKVAVKVLLPERMAGGSAEQFAAEANVMALLSTHPAIVTIYQAGVSEDRRPYLVMEYCPKPNLQVRSRAAALSVPEALRIGIQVAAAVETAHRAGILHRDIKPANILVTEYNRPALTDFGIATTAGAADLSSGMSIPWSPPESFADVPDFGVRSDVWALGATLYTLLAGRSPFEVPGGRNGGAELIERIEREPLARIDRADAPDSLQLVLERSMAKRAADRYESAVAFARALQKVQIELSHSVTPIDILDDAPDAADEDDDDGELTRVRGIVSIDPQTVPAAGRTRERHDPFAPADAVSAPASSVTSAAPWAAAPPFSGTAVPVATGADATRDSGDVTDETVMRVAVPRFVGHGESTVTRTPSAAPVNSAPVDSAPVVSAPVDSDPAVSVQADGRSRRSRAGLWFGLAAAGTAIVVVGVVAGASLLAPSPEPTPTAPVVAEPQNPIGGFVPAPADLRGVEKGDEAVFTWTNPDEADGDTYVWYPYTLEGDGEGGLLETTTVTLPASDDRTCIAVMIRRADGKTGSESRACTP